MCAIPSATFFLTFLRARAAPALGAGACAIFQSSFTLLAGRLRCRFAADARARLLRALARARVGARALAAHGKPAAMTDAAIAAQVHQSLDAHRHRAAEVAFDLELGDLLAQLVHVGVGKILYLRRALDAGRGADRLGTRAADAVDRRQCDLRVLVVRNVDACNTGHVRYLSKSSPLSLPLFVARVRANDTHDAVAPDDLAVAADLFNRSQCFHFRSSRITSRGR